MKLVKLTALATAIFLFIIVFQTRSYQQDELALKPKATIGNAQNLNVAYQNWKRQLTSYEGAEEVIVPIGWAKGLSGERTPARGAAKINYLNSSVEINIQYMSDAYGLDAWLLDNVGSDKGTVKAEAGDNLRYLGRLDQRSDSATLHAQLEENALLQFEIDAIVITKAGIHPEEGGLMYGMPGLFQRLYRDELVKLNGFDTEDDLNLFALAAPTANASEAGTSLSVLQTLVEDGEEIFFNETFDGNGRTCGTCHPAENNFTIDPEFIATLPDDDPLFVAEFIPELNFETNGGLRFENPLLMRERALIVVNADGFDDPANKFVMRSVSHVFAQALSITPSTDDGSDPGKLHRTGWDGDGSPGTGTIREFAIGAVNQHNPLTMNRVEGVDFRLPTDFELDALEAFQLSLGRQEEMDLQNMTFLDQSVAGGKARFMGQDKCHQCHGNAGAKATITPFQGTNANFDTDVEDGVNPADRLGEIMPIDGGAGHDGSLALGFGDGKFNVPSIIEAADTGPFFHDNSKESLRNAVVFYATETFNDSPAGQLVDGIVLGTGAFEIEDFLRVINTIDNLRSAEQYIARAMQVDLTESMKLMNLAKIDLDDSENVLDRGNLHGPERALLSQGMDAITDAENASSTSERDDFLNQALGLMQNALDGMVIMEGGTNNLPTASFTFSTTGLTANFTDTSTDSDGSIVSWSWDFAGQGTSNNPNPGFTFSSAGTFNVFLTVTDNDGGTNTTSQNVTVVDNGGDNNPPLASFTFSASALTADFTDTSSDTDGSVVAWSWDFGGDGTSTSQNPSHTFSGDGTFNVSLTVTDNEGATGTTSQNVTVSSGGGASTMHIEAITTAITRGAGGVGNVEATFLIHDSNGNPVADATVSGTFGGDLTGSDTGVTNGSGEVVLTSEQFSSRPSDLGICADNVTHGSLTYDAAQNSDTSFDCGTAGPNAGIANQVETPDSFTLHPNFPNPFNPTTEIRFSLEESGPVRISVFNALGQEVRVLAEGSYDWGEHSVTWDGTDNAGANMPTGTYLYQLRFNNRTYTRTMTMIK